MRDKKEYIGINCFKIIAAFLIIAIHTSPFTSFNGNLDFVFTRIWARLAVPFFFMITGYFILPQCLKEECNNIDLKKYIVKISKIYVLAIIVYVPINVYTKYFNQSNLLFNIIKDIIFDGTFYHLWYLPASMLGTMIIYFLLKKLHYKKTFYVAIILYLIGLFGDSYYGIVEKINFFKLFYQGIFFFSDYTRNGIFFSPIFILLGYCTYLTKIRLKKEDINSIVSTKGFLLSFLFLNIEGVLLHIYHIQRHDSMYIFLIPCMLYLFHILLSIEGKRIGDIKNVALFIYIFHPLFIILVRGFAKIIGLTWLIVDNSFIHYMMVLISTTIFSYFSTKIINRRRRINK